MPAPKFFASPEKFRAWLTRHGASARELVVGFHKVDSARASITWPQAVDEALCVGWIDGVRKRIDDAAYQIRFTPRKPGSTWSAINIGRVKALRHEGRMQPAGLAAFAQRKDAKSRTYSYEQADAPNLQAVAETAFRRNRRAWAFFESQPPSYRKRVIWWIASAKREATRASRLAKAIQASRDGTRL